MSFSENLLRLRREQNVKQTDIAAGTGMPVRTYQHYEHGEQEPTLSKLVILADVFGVSLDELVGRNPESKMR